MTRTRISNKSNKSDKADEMNRINQAGLSDVWVRRIAGFLVFTTAVLGYVHSKHWLFVTMFVGLNLFQYSFTDFCPLKIILKKIFKE